MCLIGVKSRKKLVASKGGGDKAKGKSQGALSATTQFPEFSSEVR